jgi:hypothetical protein
MLEHEDGLVDRVSSQIFDQSGELLPACSISLGTSFH